MFDIRIYGENLENLKINAIYSTTKLPVTATIETSKHCILEYKRFLKNYVKALFYSWSTILWLIFVLPIDFQSVKW